MTVDPDALHSFAVAIARELSALRGVPWHARRTEYDWSEIVRFDGARLLVRVDHRRPKHAAVSGRFPLGHEPWDRDRCEPMRLVSFVLLSRSPAAAAAHLARVLLPRYEALWPEAARGVDRARREDASARAFVEAAVAAGGRSSSGERVYIGGLSAHPIGGNRVEVRGSMPRALLLRISAELLEAEGDTCRR